MAWTRVVALRGKECSGSGHILKVEFIGFAGKFKARIIPRSGPEEPEGWNC